MTVVRSIFGGCFPLRALGVPYETGRLGVPYVEHDIAEFYSFVSQQSVEVSVDDSVFSL